MDEATIYLWNGCGGRSYARLQRGEKSWRVDWGRRNPPGSCNFVSYVSLESDDRARAVRWLVTVLRAVIQDTAEAEAIIAQLGDALARISDE